MQPGSGYEDFGVDTSPRTQSGTGGSIALFLSLYLLLLAFFILLVSISQGENPKTREILEGLSSQFSASEKVDNPRSFSSDLGTFVSPAEFMENMASVYETAIPAAEIKVVRPGEIMEIAFHVGTLFKFGTEDLRPAQRQVIGQLIPSLSRPPAGLRYQVEILFSFVKGPDGYPVQENSLMRKAGIVARAFLEQGAPPHAVSVAMEEATDDNKLRMIYRVVDVEREQADLQDGLPDNEQEDQAERDDAVQDNPPTATEQPQDTGETP